MGVRSSAHVEGVGPAGAVETIRVATSPTAIVAVATESVKPASRRGGMALLNEN